jgi:hypothetical protein
MLPDATMVREAPLTDQTDSFICSNRLNSGRFIPRKGPKANLSLKTLSNEQQKIHRKMALPDVPLAIFTKEESVIRLAESILDGFQYCQRSLNKLIHLGNRELHAALFLELEEIVVDIISHPILDINTVSPAHNTMLSNQR